MRIRPLATLLPHLSNSEAESVSAVTPRRFCKIHRLTFPVIWLALASFAALAIQSLHASDWSGTNASWGSNGNPGWNGTGVPDATGAVANHGVTTTSNTTQDTGAPVSVGTISLTNNSDNSWTINNVSGLTLEQDGFGGPGSSLISNTNSFAGTNNFLSISGGTLALNDDWMISNTGASTNTTGAIQITSAISGSGSLTLSNASTAVSATNSISIGGANMFGGPVLVQKGTTSFTSATAFGSSGNLITLGQSGQGSAALVANASLGTVGNSITVAFGSGGTLVLGSVSTLPGATVTYGGAITLNGDLSLTSAATTGTGVTLSGVVSGAGALTKIGGGIATISNAGNNTYTGRTTVNNGTLVLAKPAGLNAISSTGATGADAANTDLQINTGGTVRLNSSNQIVNTATIGLSGGTLALNGFAEGAAGTAGVGAFSLSANSTIDFALGATNSLIRFAGVATHTPITGPDLQIANWNGVPATGGGTERLLFSGITGNFTTQYDQSDVFFNGVSGYVAVQFTGFYEITAVPEPSTWTCVFLAVGTIGWMQRRRLSALLNKTD